MNANQTSGFAVDVRPLMEAPAHAIEESLHALANDDPDQFRHMLNILALVAVQLVAGFVTLPGAPSKGAWLLAVVQRFRRDYPEAVG